MNLLITGAWPQAREMIPQIEEMGHKVVFMQQEKDPLPCDPKKIEGIVCNCLFLTHPIEAFPNLRYIQLTSAGYDRIPKDYVQSHHIEIHNARGVYSIPLAEFAVAGVLSLYKGLGKFHDQQKAHTWEKNRNLRELTGRTVVIIGCGSVGTECAKRFGAFDCKVIGVDIVLQKDERYSDIVDLSRLDEKLRVADIVVLTLPLTDETHHLMNTERLALLKPGAVLVNIARGALINTSELIAVLPNLFGAVLDVFEEEPLPETSSLWDFENVIITPHNSFVGNNNGDRLWKIIRNNLEKKL